MKKKPNTVLMICYYFPPLQTSGVSRSIGYANNLQKFNWEPIVLTVKDSKDPWVHKSADSKKNTYNYEIIRSREIPLAKLCDLLHGIECKLRSWFGLSERHNNRFRDFLAFPDPQISWFSSIPAILNSSKFDIIYASCSPYSSALSAVIIKLITKKRLVLDFRDPWPITISKPEKRNSLLSKLHFKLEKFVISHTDHLILNTAGSKKLYDLRYPDFSEKFSFIPNGFDEFITSAPIKTSALVKKDKKLKIMHFGTFYENRTPNNLLEAIRIINNKDIEFIQVGDYHSELDKYKDKISLTHIPTVSKSESVKLMFEADILYLKQAWSEDWTQNTAIAAKTYEYLTTGIPILCDCPEGDNAEIIREYGPTSQVVTSNNPEDLVKAILLMQSESKDTLNKIEGPSKEYLESYNRVALTEKLSDIFSLLKNN